MRILVTYGTKRQGTAEIAAQIGDVLRSQGHTVDVINAAEQPDVGPYDAVLVGGALYMFHWQRNAVRFVKRHREELRDRPVWFFSSGPLDDSAKQKELAPVGQVRRLMAHVGARGHKTFGGRITPDANTSLAKEHSGDWRDPQQIQQWAAGLAEQLRTEPARARAAATPARPSKWARPLTALCLFSGVTAIAGGLELIIRPDGSLLHLPLSLLQHSPFADFLIPGILLCGVVGLSNLVAGVMMLRKSRRAGEAAFFGGGAMTVWMIVEMILLRTTHPLQLFYLAVGIATMWLSLRQGGWRHTHAPGGSDEAGSRPDGTRSALPPVGGLRPRHE